MNQQPAETALCGCGEKLEPLYNPVTGRWLKTHASCARCLEKNEHMEEAAKKEAELKAIRERIQPLLKTAGVPNHFLNASLSNYQTSPATQSILDRIGPYPGEKPPHGLFLFGPTGVGKTHLAAALARAFLLQGDPVLFQNLHRLLLNIRSSFTGDPAQTEKAQIDRLRDARVLILDDLGAEQLSPWSRSIVSMIVNDRYESSHRRLIITSNLNPKQIEQTYSPRTASRIHGMCEALRVHGPDFRSRKR